MFREQNYEKDYAYYYKQFCRIGHSLPEYMSNNLKNMPNNKGYIWKNCWFLGLLKSDYRYPLVLFEKTRERGVLYIHEIDYRTYKIFEKRGAERKVLIRSSYRKNIC